MRYPLYVKFIILFYFISYMLDNVFAHEEHTLDIDIERQIPIGSGCIVSTTVMDPTIFHSK